MCLNFSYISGAFDYCVGCASLDIGNCTINLHRRISCFRSDCYCLNSRTCAYHNNRVGAGHGNIFKRGRSSCYNDIWSDDLNVSYGALDVDVIRAVFDINYIHISITLNLNTDNAINSGNNDIGNRGASFNDNGIYTATPNNQAPGDFYIIENYLTIANAVADNQITANIYIFQGNAGFINHQIAAGNRSDNTGSIYVLLNNVVKQLSKFGSGNWISRV